MICPCCLSWSDARSHSSAAAAPARSLLEEILDDDQELAQLNLSSRPAREDRQRERERDRLKRTSDWWGFSQLGPTAHLCLLAERLWSRVHLLLIPGTVPGTCTASVSHTA